MKVRLINSAMMPKEGDYEYRSLDADIFFEKIKEAAKQNRLIHYIGYQQNIDLINKNTGLNLTPNRKQTLLQHEDELLIMKLSYRKDMQKGKKINPDDFEYGIAKYTDHKYTAEFNRFLDKLKNNKPAKYNFENDETTTPEEGEQWKRDILALKAKAKEILGVGYQKKIAEGINVKPQSIQRLFSLKFSPTYKILYLVIDYLDLSINFQEKRK